MPKAVVCRELGPPENLRLEQFAPVPLAPGQVLTWDITKLAGPTRGLYYDAYVMIVRDESAARW